MSQPDSLRADTNRERDDWRAARLPISTWNTDAAPLKERFDVHREEVCRSMVPLTPQRPDTQEFYSRGRVVSLGAAAIITMEYTGMLVERTSADVAASTSAGFFLQTGLSPGIRLHSMDHGRHSFLATPGQLVLTPSDRHGTYDCSHLAHVEQAAFWIPENALRDRLPAGHFPSAMRVSDDPLVGRIVSQVSQTLVEAASCASAQEIRRLFDVLLDLVALAISRKSEVATPHPEISGMRLILLREIEKLLHREGLRVQHVAHRLGITPRYVHKLFEESGTTFGRYVLERRLDGAARDLRDPGLSGRQISQIAFHWGFGDLSHFSRTFRTRFGSSPTRWRMDPG